jgi:hypothetical protein
VSLARWLAGSLPANGRPARSCGFRPGRSQRSADRAEPLAGAGALAITAAATSVIALQTSEDGLRFYWRGPCGSAVHSRASISWAGTAMAASSWSSPSACRSRIVGVLSLAWACCRMLVTHAVARSILVEPLLPWLRRLRVSVS